MVKKDICGCTKLVYNIRLFFGGSKGLQEAGVGSRGTDHTQSDTQVKLHEAGVFNCTDTVIPARKIVGQPRKKCSRIAQCHKV